jgi:hypothetical protein
MMITRYVKKESMEKTATKLALVLFGLLVMNAVNFKEDV